LIAAVPERTATRDALVREVADRLDVPAEYVLAGPSGVGPSAHPGRGRLGGARAAERGAAGSEGGGAAAGPAPGAERVGTATFARVGASPGEASLAAERAYLVMCLASGDLGRDFLDRLSREHFSSAATRAAREHLLANFADPLAGLPEDDPAAAALVTGVAMAAQEQNEATEAVLRMSFLQLEQRRIEREIRRAAERGDHARQDKLAGARQDVRREMDAVMGQTA